MVALLNISLQSIGFLHNLQILDQIDHGFHRITVRAQPVAASVSCTGCGTPARRVHGAYWRSLRDVASFGRFTEPLPGVARPRARQTDRPQAMHRTIGLALGGNPGYRHATAIGVPISRTTLGHRSADAP